MPRKKHADHENHERWLVSYADFMTLLFAFFVVMFASSQADKSKAKQVADSVREALEEGKVSGAISKALGYGPKPGQPNPADAAKDAAKKAQEEQKAEPAGAPLAAAVLKAESVKPDLAASVARLQEALARELRAGKMGVTLEPRGLVISLREAAFFASGNDVLNPDSYASIQKVADLIRSLPNSVRLEGHTDSIPIHNSRFRSNWELSAARSIAMLEILAERCEVPRSRMAISGYAETAPTDTNDTPEGRARNRRVDVVILTQGALQSEPPQHSGAPARSPI